MNKKSKTERREEANFEKLLEALIQEHINDIPAGLIQEIREKVFAHKDSYREYDQNTKISKVQDLLQPYTMSKFNRGEGQRDSMNMVYDTLEMDILNDLRKVLGDELPSKRRLQTEMELLDFVEKGISKAAFYKLAQYIQEPIYRICSWLPIDARTIQRKKTTDRLSSSVTSLIVDLAYLFLLGERVFGSFEKFKIYLSKPKRAFGGRTPYDLLATHQGIHLIRQELGRIAHGIAA